MKRIIGIFCCVVYCSSCMNDDAPAVRIENLEGRWEIAEAFRDGKPTQTLRDGFFDFSRDSMMKTNIFQDSSLYTIDIQGRQILVLDPMKNKYTVTKLIHDSLILTTKVRKFDFRFIATKSAGNEQD